MILQILLNNLFTVGVLMLTTLGIALTYKSATVANFAQQSVATVGAFLAAYLFMRQGVNPWVAALGGIAACFVLGWIIDALIVGKMTAARAGRIMIVIGLVLVIGALTPLVFGMIPYSFPRFFTGNLTWEKFGASFTLTRNGLFTFGVAVAVVTIVFTALNVTKWGLKVRATASDKTVAAMMGINTDRVTATSWAISSACAALAAVLHAAQTTNVTTEMMIPVQTTALLAFVMGGFTSFYGPVIGAIIIPLTAAMLALISGLWANVFLQTLVLLVILIKPIGLFGKKIAVKV